MVTFLVIVVVICFACAIYSIASKGSSTPNQQMQDALTPEQKTWLQNVGRIYAENRVMPFLDVLVECGMPKEIAYSKNGELIKQNIPFNAEETRHDGNDVFRAYQFAITQRYELQNDELSPIDASTYGLNMQKDEILYHRINNVTLHKEKTLKYNIAYTGIKWQCGMLRAGTMSVIGNEITHFQPMDIGRLFITNQRILFVGKQNNVTTSTPIKSVLFYNLYQDGVLVNVPNRKPILLKFTTGYNTDIISVEDGLNEFVIVLNRIILGTEKTKLN